MLRQFSAVIATTGALLVLAACGLEEQVVNISESGLASEGATEFENVGVEIQGDLDCTLAEKPGVTDENGDPAYTLGCTGLTITGEEATIDGDTEQSSFVGKVNGEEVWSKDCIGSDC
jgi:hypothetical protein